jgi:hypothetical protein
MKALCFEVIINRSKILDSNFWSSLDFHKCVETTKNLYDKSILLTNQCDDEKVNEKEFHCLQLMLFALLLLLTREMSLCFDDLETAYIHSSLPIKFGQ